MNRYIRFSFAIAVSAVIAYVYTLPVGIFLHTLLGNEPEVIRADIEGSFRHTLGVILVALALMCAFITVHVLMRRDIWQRNSDATVLARKFVFSRLAGDRVMSEEEEKRFHDYRESGILTYNSNGVIRVSDRAVSDLWD